MDFAVFWAVLLDSYGASWLLHATPKSWFTHSKQAWICHLGSLFLMSLIHPELFWEIDERILCLDDSWKLKNHSMRLRIPQRINLVAWKGTCEGKKSERKYLHMVKQRKQGFVQITSQAEEPAVLGERKTRCVQSTHVVYWMSGMKWERLYQEQDNVNEAIKVWLKDLERIQGQHLYFILHK